MRLVLKNVFAKSLVCYPTAIVFKQLFAKSGSKNENYHQSASV